MQVNILTNPSFFKYLVALAILYLIIVGGLLSISNGVPYVMDNNETWSNLGHAKNAFDYGLSLSSGLADEANEYSGDRPEAHPLVHTHQGNFPRLLATGLYFAGVRSAAGQIALVTFTIGLAGFLLAYAFFCRVLGIRMALLACGFMLTDYIMFLQWQVNTWRVWQTIFFFGSLYFIERISRDRKINLFDWISLYLVIASTFYSELVFASFIFATSVSYAVFRNWHSRKRLAAIIFTLCFAAATSAVILALQLVNYYGLDALIQDAKYTISLRNLVSDPERRAAAVKFMQENNVLFLWNFSTGTLRSFEVFYNTGFKAIVAWTPIFALLCGISCIPALYFFFLAKFQKYRTSQVEESSPSNCNEQFTKLFLNLKASLATVVFFISVFLFFNSLLNAPLIGFLSNASGSKIFGFGQSFSTTLIVGFTATFFCILLRSRIFKNASRALVVASAVLIFISLVLQSYTNPFPVNLTPIWTLFFSSSRYFLIPLTTLLVFACIFTICLATQVNQSHLARVFARLLPLVVSSGIGFFIAWLWSPGYLSSGYLDRACPILTYALYVFPAFAIYSLIYCYKISKFRGSKILGLIVTVSLISILALWLRIQFLFAFLLPPNFASFILEAQKPQYNGAGIAASNYAVPFAFTCNGWGWIARVNDESFNLNSPSAIDYDPVNFWIAEIGKSEFFRNPDFFFYSNQPHSLEIAAQRARQLLNPILDYSKLPPIISRAMAGSQPVFENRIVAKDPSIWNAWMVLQLDKRSAPYINLELGHAQNSADLLEKSNNSVGPAFSLESKAPSTSILNKKSSEQEAEKSIRIAYEFVPSSKPLVKGDGVLTASTTLQEQKVVVTTARERQAFPANDDSFSPAEIVATGMITAFPNDSISFTINSGTPDGYLICRSGGNLKTFALSASDQPRRIVFDLNDDREISGSTNSLPLEKESGVKETCTGPVRVLLVETPHSKKMLATPQYQYRHVGELEEGESLWKLWHFSSDRPMRLVAEKVRGEGFILNPDQSGEFIISVIPKDINGRRGYEYFSAPFILPKAENEATK